MLKGSLTPNQKRRSSVAALALFGALLLTGCDPLTQSDAPIAFRGSGEAFEVLLCETMVITRVLGQSRAPSEREWDSFWRATGSAHVSSEDVLGAASAPVGLDATAWDPPSLQAGDTLSLTLTSSTETISVTLGVPEDGMPSVDWLLPDGTVDSEPCK